MDATALLLLLFCVHLRCRATSTPDTDSASLLLLIFLFCFVATLCVNKDVYKSKTTVRREKAKIMPTEIILTVLTILSITVVC